jgi:endonuclease III
MRMPDQKETVRMLLKRYRLTFAEELGINVGANTSSELFKLLCASILFSTRIGAKVAMRAATAIFEKGWTTPEKLVKAGWDSRTVTLNRSGYARYDGRGSMMLGDSAQMVIDKYGGDMRKLREAAGRDPAKERDLLKEFKGIGNVGADIFLREVQAAWEEVFPFLDKRAAEAARKLGLKSDPYELVRIVGKQNFTRLTAALIRSRIEKVTRAELKS